MEQGQADDLIHRLYDKLFYLPSVWLLSAAYTVEGIFIIIFNALLGGRGLTPAILSTLAGMAYYIASTHIFFISGGVVDTYKKALGIAVVSLAPYLVVEALSARSGPGYASFSSSAGMLFLVHYIFKGGLLISAAVALAIALPSSTISVLSIDLLEEPRLLGDDLNRIPGHAAISLASIASFTVFIAVLELGGRINSMKIFDLARGFLKSWLFGDNSLLERAFSKNASQAPLKIRVLTLHREGKKRLHMIYPGFHYGPFRNVGSSDAVHIIDDLMGRRGELSLVFHTVGSHDRNLVSRAEVSRIAEELSQILSRDAGHGDLAPLRGPVRVSRGAWQALTLGGGACVAAHISNSRGSDDLPDSVEKIAMGIEKSGGVMIAIADSHNNVGREHVDEEAMAEMLVEACDAISRPSSEAPVLVGYGEASMSRPCRGMCKGSVKVLVVENGEGRHAMIYIYGNNIHRSARSGLVAHLISKGFRDVEIVTPDDHSCAAVSIDTAYVSVHMCPELLKAIDAAVKTALEDLSPALVSCSEHVWPSVGFMGKAVWNYLRGLEILGPITPRLWAITLLFSVAVSSILSSTL